MYKLTNKKIVGILGACLAFNGFIWLLVGLLSLPISVREFSMGFFFSMTILCAVLLVIPESRRLQPQTVNK